MVHITSCQCLIWTVVPFIIVLFVLGHRWPKHLNQLPLFSIDFCSNFSKIYSTISFLAFTFQTCFLISNILSHTVELACSLEFFFQLICNLYWYTRTTYMSTFPFHKSYLGDTLSHYWYLLSIKLPLILILVSKFGRTFIPHNLSGSCLNYNYLVVKHFFTLTT